MGSRNIRVGEIREWIRFPSTFVLLVSMNCDSQFSLPLWTVEELGTGKHYSDVRSYELGQRISEMEFLARVSVT